ncbi:MAG TPA: M28 family peptidase [Bacteroidales bacterium]|jgi:hypothetical protein|nr:M28 family peptidase [Bacteroidales bacterium]
MLRFALALIFVLQFLSLSCQDIEYARKVIRTLSSPELKGRGFTGNGHQIAARYIGKQFLATGLESFKSGSDNARNINKLYFQPFEIRVNSFPSKMTVEIDAKKLIAGSEFLVHPSSSPGKGKYSLYLVKKMELANNGALQKITKESVGKIIVIDARNFATDNKEVLQKADEAIEIIEFSSQLQSAGTIILTDEKLTWSISTDRAVKPIVIINSSKIGTNPLEARINVKAEYSVHTTNNVIGYIPGKQTPDSFILIIAHYDHLGTMGKDAYFPGANDNASGVAMLLSLASHFKLNPHKYSMVFMALAAEETGLNGARYFISNPVIDLKRIAFLINFDLAGTGDEGIKVVNGTVYPEQFGLLKKINNERGYLKDVQVRGPACNSDHCIFHEKGIPCFYIYTLGGIKAYHDIFDRFETLPLTEFSDYMKLMIEFLQNI